VPFNWLVRQRWLTVVVALLVLGLGCSRDDQVNRIRQLVEDGAHKAERHDVEGMLSLATDGFRLEPGNRGRDGVRDGLAAAFLYYRRFRLLFPEPAVKIDDGGAAATATVPFLVVREDRTWPSLERLYSDPQRWLEEVGENADLYHLGLRLTKREEGWRVESAQLSSVRTPRFLP